MSSRRQLANATLDSLEASLSRFYLREEDSTLTVTSSGSGSRGFKMVATETKVVQETTRHELELHGGDGDSDSGESFDEDSNYGYVPDELREYLERAESGLVELCEVPYEAVADCPELVIEEGAVYEGPGSPGPYEDQGGHIGYVEAYDGGYELDSYGGGGSDYGGYYSQNDDYDDGDYY